MAETSGHDIVPGRESGIRKFIESARSLVRRPEMDLARARAILKQVVATHENSLQEDSDLNHLGQYSIKDVRKALGTVSLDVIQKHKPKYNTPDFAVVEKYTDSHLGHPIRGEKVIFFLYLSNNKLESVAMQLGGGEDKRGHLIVTHVPIASIKDTLDAFYAGVFNDQRPGHKTEAQPFGQFHLEEYRKSWLGFRWLADNLLNWDTGFKLPEELSPTQPKLDYPPQKYLPGKT